MSSATQNRVCLAAACLMLAGGAARAGRPLVVGDAGTVDYRTFEFELGGYFEHDPGCDHWEYPFALTYGLVPNVEIGVGFGGQFEERTEVDCPTERVNGLGDLTIGAKWQFLPESTWLPGQAIAPAVKFPTGDRDKGLSSGKTDFDLTWAASKTFAETLGAHVNVGYSWIGEPDDEEVGDILHYGLALDYQLLESLQVVGEVFADKELRSGTDTAAMYNGGLRWNPVESVTLDAAAGSRLAGDAPEFIATAGLTWAFGLWTTAD